MKLFYPKTLKIVILFFMVVYIFPANMARADTAARDEFLQRILKQQELAMDLDYMQQPFQGQIAFAAEGDWLANMGFNAISFNAKFQVDIDREILYFSVEANLDGPVSVLLFGQKNFRFSGYIHQQYLILPRDTILALNKLMDMDSQSNFSDDMQFAYMEMPDFDFATAVKDLKLQAEQQFANILITMLVNIMPAENFKMDDNYVSMHLGKTDLLSMLDAVLSPDFRADVEQLLKEDLVVADDLPGESEAGSGVDADELQNIKEELSSLIRENVSYLSWRGILGHNLLRANFTLAARETDQPANALYAMSTGQAVWWEDGNVWQHALVGRTGTRVIYRDWSSSDRLGIFLQSNALMMPAYQNQSVKVNLLSFLDRELLTLTADLKAKISSSPYLRVQLPILHEGNSVNLEKINTLPEQKNEYI